MVCLTKLSPIGAAKSMDTAVHYMACWNVSVRNKPSCVDNSLVREAGFTLRLPEGLVDARLTTNGDLGNFGKKAFILFLLKERGGNGWNGKNCH